MSKAISYNDFKQFLRSDFIEEFKSQYEIFFLKILELFEEREDSLSDPGSTDEFKTKLVVLGEEIRKEMCQLGWSTKTPNFKLYMDFLTPNDIHESVFLQVRFGLLTESTGWYSLGFNLKFPLKMY